MLVISNNLIDKMPLPYSAIIRINLAWIKSKEELRHLLDNKHDIYLDFPDGRKKPPVPTFTIEEAVEFAKHPNVKYFAISNAEDVDFLKRLDLDKNTELIPKIETIKGVHEIPAMIKMGIKTIMLDKEDLYTDCDCDATLYNLLLDEVRKNDIKILELQGVVFI